MTPQTLSLSVLRPLLRPRPADGHKGTFGHALVVAGRWGMAGASVLAAKACMRSGVGKCTLHIPRANNDIVQISVPEVIISHDVDQQEFTTPVSLGIYDALAIGPGLGTSAPTIEAVGRQLAMAAARNTNEVPAVVTPCVVDADALNALALQPALFSMLPEDAVLTPHPAEYRRMAADEAPQRFAQRLGVYLVLKGHPTHVYTPDGGCYECPWGNSGMGTAGSGDVLTGIIVALLAEGYAPRESALLGVSLHALAGDAAACSLGEHSLMASDIIAHLPEAFKCLGV